MVKNTGKAYEQLTQEIFQSLLNQRAVTNITVEHDIDLPGASTTHQIDVYWKFKDNEGDEREVIVQCKDHGSAINQEKVLTLMGVMKDLPGDPVGVIVTRTGYQQGAQRLASHYGIMLYELRAPTEDDWESRVQKVIFDVKLIQRQSKLTDLQLDQSWILNERSKTEHDNTSHPFSIKETSETLRFFNSAGNEIDSYERIREELWGVDLRPITRRIHTIEFKEDTFVRTDSTIYPFVKVLGLKVEVWTDEINESWQFDGADFVHYILKNTLDSTIITFDHDKKPRNSIS